MVRLTVWQLLYVIVYLGITVACADTRPYVRTISFRQKNKAVSPGRIFLALALTEKRFDSLFLIDINGVFGIKNSTKRLILDTIDIASRIFVDYNYVLRGQNPFLHVDSTLLYDTVLNTRLRKPHVGEKRTYLQPISNPLSQSIRDINDLMSPYYAIFLNPMMTTLPFVFKLFVGIKLHGSLDTQINVGNNILTIFTSSQNVPVAGVIFAPVNSEVESSGFHFMHSTYLAYGKDFAAYITIPLSRSQHRQSFVELSETVKVFFKYESYRHALSMGQRITMRMYTRYGCSNTSNPLAFFQFATLFGIGWSKFLKLAIEGYVTDDELNRFLWEMREWSSRAIVCFGGTGIESSIDRVTISDPITTRLHSVLERILESVNGYKWHTLTIWEHSEIIETIFSSVINLGLRDFVERAISSDGWTPSDLALRVLHMLYADLMSGKLYESATARMMSAALRILTWDVTMTTSKIRQALAIVTSLCTELVENLPDTNDESFLDPEISHSAYSISDSFSPCSLALRFNKFASSKWKMADIHGYSVMKNVAVRPNRVMSEKVSEINLSSRMLVSDILPEVETCVDWSRIADILLVMPTYAGSWILSTDPLARGSTYKVLGTSTDIFLYLSFVNASCHTSEPWQESISIPDGHLEVPRYEKDCKLCGNYIIRYSLGGIHDVAFINNLATQRELMAKKNSSFMYFRNLAGGYYQYILLSSDGRAMRILGFSQSSTVITKDVIIGMIVGITSGLIALGCLARVVWNYTKQSFGYRRL
ncbi:glycoprotein H [Psittacid alphaherpesvirus 5]|uniref:Glycoprotein H n=1 Tax=Psittacid alphaherpesvirus 5 TaxID=2972693 RepID=A0A5P9JQZ6_9ALPH|nr:glycoprotein H [Psittacid alphaherpesvirus 5]QFU14559.1 glycoprotein H [Psittacid alphaherpesvirus 5]